MKDKDKTQEQLIKELTQLRRRIAELEGCERQRKQVEETLKRSDQEKTVILGSISELVAYQDTRMRILWVNRAAAESVGVDPQQLVGRHCYEIWPQRDRPCVGCPVVKARKSGQPQEAEITTPDGRVWLIRGYPVRDTKGNVTGAVEITLEITERKQAENTLRESETRFRTLFEAIPDTVMVHDDEGNILHINEIGAQRLEWSAKDLVGRNLRDIVTPENAASIADHVRETHKVGWSRFETTYVSRSGWQIIAEVTERSIKFGEVKAILSVAHDITDRKQIEEALRASEEQFRQFFENEPEYCYMISPEGLILNVNNAALSALGYTKEELVGKPLQMIYAPESVPKMEQLYSKWKKTGQLKDEEMVIITKKGERRTVLLSAGAVKDSDGKILHSISVQKDITERKNIEDALRESEERFRKVVETMKVGLATCDENGILTYVNEYSSSMIGYSADEMVGHDPTDFYYDEEQRKAQKEIFEKRRKGMRDAPTHEVAWRTKDGRKVYSILSPTPIFDAEGRYTGSFAIHTEITERKRIEGALRESEEKYRELINGMNDTAWVIDFEGNFIDVNNAAVEVLGYSREELLSMGPHDIDNTLDAEEIRALIKEMPTDEIQVFETTHTTKDRKVIPVEIKSSLVTYQGKRAILSIARDITDRKQAEEALRESEERFRRVVETMEVGLGAIDENGVFTYVNKYFSKMLGYSIDDMIGRSTFEFFYDEKQRQAQKEVLAKRRAGTRDPASYELTWRRKDGQKVYTILSPTPMFDADGHYTGSFAIHTDITERKRIEEALRESEEEFRTFMETASDLMHISDKDLNFTYVNKAMARTLGYSKEEMIGMNLAQIVKKEVLQKDFKRNLESLKKQGEINFETIRVAKDGKEIHGEVKLVAIFDKDGAFAGTRGVFRDITERKQAEEVLQSSYEQLRETLMTTVDALASTVEMKDQYTAGHQQRVTQLACAIAEEMDLSEEQIEGIRMAGLIHDVGKIMVPAEILNKPGSLTEIQYELVKMHPQAGYDILKDIKFPWPVAQMVLQHHERMDGSGYPQGLSGEEILLEARILAVANVVEAMVSHRPYRAAYGIKEALAEISKNKGILYDPVVVDACSKLFTEMQFTFD